MSFSKNISSAIKKLHPNIYPINAKGSWITSVNGKEYLDLTSGIGALSTGHSHPYIINHVKSQLNKYVHMPQQLFNIHSISNEFTGKLLDIMPYKSLDSVFYVNSGSEATDNAIKIARSYTKKQNVITMHRGFHGRTIGALSVTSSNLTSKQNIASLLPGVYFSEINDIESFKKLLNFQTSPHDTACVIYEPVQGEGGIFSLEKNFLTEIHNICKELNILTIADEVQCGFGRTGTFWNIEQKGVEPDILTFGKGIASGFPLAGLVSRTEIMDNIGTNFLGGTYGGNAMCLAAASATIDIMNKEEILFNVIQKGELLKQGLEIIPNVKYVRQYGLMIAIEFTENIDTIAVGNIIKKMNEQGILLLRCGNEGQYIRILPPLNISKFECETFLEIFTNIVSEYN